jgi:hypothetical protein
MKSKGKPKPTSAKAKTKANGSSAASVALATRLPAYAGGVGLAPPRGKPKSRRPPAR